MRIFHGKHNRGMRILVIVKRIEIEVKEDRKADKDKSILYVKL